MANPIICKTIQPAAIKCRMPLKRSLLTAAALALGVASGCAVQAPADLNSVSAGTNVTPEVISSTPYAIQAMLPQQGDYARLRIYIEGDGRDWTTSRQSSIDPTPANSVVAGFAAHDKRPSVYLARPCQFVKSAGCTTDLWTSKQFGPEVINAYSSALDGLKERFNARELELIGYSGGGTIALLLAAKRDDVVGVQTIAGNLDTEAWIRKKRLPPMSGSENPADYAEKLSRIPQRHIIGQADNVVPAYVTRSYMLKLNSRCAEVVEVEADHLKGYDVAWESLSGEPYACLQKTAKRMKSAKVVGQL